MQNIKSSLFLYLTQRQKSQLLGTLKSYYKKFINFSIEEIAYKFLEDEKYYLDIENPHFEFVGEYLEDDNFFNDLKKFLKYCEWENNQKKAMEPYLERQKELAKIQRKKAADFKMSKLKPTKKQLFYYDKITKSHGIVKKDTENASRLDLKNWIMEILEEKDDD